MLFHGVIRLLDPGLRKDYKEDMDQIQLLHNLKGGELFIFGQFS